MSQSKCLAIANQNMPFSRRMVKPGGNLQATPNTNPQIAATSKTDVKKP